MSLSKKFQILLILFFAFLGSFFITQNTKAEQPQSPIILNAFQIDYGDNIKIQVEGLVGIKENVLVYINQKYYGMANIKEIDQETNKFYYKSKLIKKSPVFEIMIVSRNIESLILSAPSIITAKSIIVKNTANSFETLAENEEKKEILAKNYDYYNEKDLILANILSTTSEKNVSLLLAKNISAPTLLSPTFKTIIGTPKPLITGVAINDTFIHIYIDGIYNGKIKTTNHPSGVGNFAYRPFLNLSVDRHNVWAISENSLGQKSINSNLLEFVIEYPMPAPTLLTPLGETAFISNPLISGLAKNDSFIKIFIDHELEKAFSIKNDLSGVGNFAYTSDKSLNRGSHLIYTTATDNRGKESVWSNIKYFSKYRPRLMSTSTEEENSDKIGNISATSIDVEKMSDLPDNLNGKVKGDMEKGLLEEIKEKEREKNKFQVNLTIFILFLTVIIIWMFLVSRELKNEKGDSNRKL